MTSDFLLYLKNLSEGESDKIAVLPFYDNQALMSDEVLFDGIPILIYDMFSSKNRALIHPYVTMPWVRELGLSGEALQDSASAQKLAEKSGAHFVIFGSFQRSVGDKMRVIINVWDAKKKITLPTPYEFSTTLSDSFFPLMRNALKNAFKDLKAGKLDDVDFLDPTLQAFRFYSKGLRLASTYDLKNLELSALWFEKALKESYQRYDDAALNLARVYFMMSLMQKLHKADFSQYFFLGKRALTYVTRADLKNTPKYAATYRFVEETAPFLAALNAFAQKNASQATTQAERGLQLVPEDGILQTIWNSSGGSLKKKNGFSTVHAVCP